jgi:hypothetical protein
MSLASQIAAALKKNAPPAPQTTAKSALGVAVPVTKAITLDDKTAADLMLGGAADAMWAARRALSDGDMTKFSTLMADALAKLNAVSSGIGGGGAAEGGDATQKNALPPAGFVVANFTPEGFNAYAQGELAKAKTDEENGDKEKAEKRLIALQKAVRIVKAQFFEADGKMAGDPLWARATIETAWAPDGGKVMDLTDTKEQSVKELTIGKPVNPENATLYSSNVVKMLEGLGEFADALNVRVGKADHNWPVDINHKPVAKNIRAAEKPKSVWGKDSEGTKLDDHRPHSHRQTGPRNEAPRRAVRHERRGCRRRSRDGGAPRVAWLGDAVGRPCGHLQARRPGACA